MYKKTILFFVIFFSFLNISFAQNIKIDKSADLKILSDIEIYLNKIKYFKANFIQDNITESQLCEGEFYLSRPGKLRVDYKNPFEATLYSNLRTTIYYDKELDEVNSIRTVSTPLYFLLKDNISFSKDNYSIMDFKNEKEFVYISFKENGKEDQGILTLKFNKKPIELNSIKLLNNLDQEIEMKLFKITKKAIDESLFKFEKTN